MRFFLAAILLLTGYTGKAQKYEYWVAYMENLDLFFNDHPQFSVVIHSAELSNVNISIPATGYTDQITLLPGETKEYVFPESILYEFGSNQIGNTGILVSADHELLCYAYHYRAYFTEATSMLNKDQLGKSYTVLAENGDNPAKVELSQLIIVATEDFTELKIVPSVHTVDLFPANKEFTISLNRGETYQLQSGEDLTGTTVSSNNMIAVYSGSKHSSICNISFYEADNHLYDINLSTDAWGKEYFAIPFKDTDTTYVKVVASTTNSTITWNGQIHVLNKSKSVTFPITSTVLIQTTEPVGIALLHPSSACTKNKTGDPTFQMLYPNNGFISSAGFYSTHTRYSYNHYLNIIAKSANIDVLLNGQSVINHFETSNDNPDFMSAQIPVPAGFNEVQADSGFIAYAYGEKQFDAYSYAIGSVGKSEDIPNANCITFIPNLITPNKDGFNEKFILSELGYELKIYNRWEGKIFESPSYTNNWPNKDVNDGIYFYQVMKENCPVKTGWVQVLK